MEQIKGLTLGTVAAEQKAETKATYRTIDYVISVLVVVLILAARTSISRDKTISDLRFRISG
ncbi:MAG: hypothetical protein R2825_02820 [Saprospiraceae bacterium]